MKKLVIIYVTLIALMIGLTIFFIFPINKSQEPIEHTMEGIVKNVSGKTFVLVEDFSTEDVLRLTEQEILEKGGVVAYFTHADESLQVQVGDEVEVWYSILDTSNPAYGISEKVEIKK